MKESRPRRARTPCTHSEQENDRSESDRSFVIAVLPPLPTLEPAPRAAEEVLVAIDLPIAPTDRHAILHERVELRAFVPRGTRDAYLTAVVPETFAVLRRIQCHLAELRVVAPRAARRKD